MRQFFSFEVTPEFELRYAASLAEREAVNKIILERTLATDMSFGLAMGVGRLRTFCQTGYKAAVKFPIVIDEDTHFTLLDYKGNIEFDTFWYKHSAQRKTIINQDALIEGLHGRSMMNKAQHVKDKLEEKKDLPKYKADYDELNQYYADRAEASKETSKNNALLSEAEKIIAAKKE